MPATLETRGYAINEAHERQVAVLEPPAACTTGQTHAEVQVDRPGIVSNLPHDFAHPSEAEVARLLEFYQLQYEYEPRTFPLQWSPDGRVTLSFTPDFYLPELDLFVELTTLKQSLVTKKNRKLRRLRELYPDINIKLFYLRDFRNLMAKYGMHGSPVAGKEAHHAQAMPSEAHDPQISE